MLTPRVCVPSIMHSGTRFLCAEILKGYRPQNARRPVESYRLAYIRCHTIYHSTYLLDPYIYRYPSIAPMRHPARIAKSFMDRKLEKKEYKSQFRVMMELADKIPILFVQLDLPDISPWVRLAGEMLGNPELEIDRDKIYSELQSDNNVQCNTGYGMHWVTPEIMDFYNYTLGN